MNSLRPFTLVLAIAASLFFHAYGQDLAWRSGAGIKAAKVTPAGARRAGFVRLDGASTGLLFTNYVSRELSLTNSPINSGSGIAAGDIDGDGRCDLYFCNLEGPNKLFRNLGDWRFEDITVSA